MDPDAPFSWPLCQSNGSHWWERMNTQNAPPSSDPINYLPLASVSLRDKYSRRVVRGWARRGEVHEWPVTRNECLRAARDRYTGGIGKIFLQLTFFPLEKQRPIYNRKSSNFVVPSWMEGKRNCLCSESPNDFLVVQGENGPINSNHSRAFPRLEKPWTPFE